MKSRIIKSMCLIVFGAAVGWFLSALNSSGDNVGQSQSVAADSVSINQVKKVSVVISGTTNLELNLVVVSKAKTGGPKLFQETVVLPYEREWDAKLLGAWVDYDRTDWEVGDGFQLAIFEEGIKRTECSTEKFRHSGNKGSCYVGNF